MKNKSQPWYFLSVLLSALTISISTIPMCLAFAQIIYGSVNLHAYVPIGAACFLLGSSICLFITTTFSKFPTALSCIQDEPMPMTLIMVTAIAAGITGSHELFPNVFLTIALSSCLTGVFLVLLGLFNLGSLVRFMPYAVMAAFITCAGWLLMLATLSASARVTLDSFSSIPHLFEGFCLARWGSVVVFGTLLFIFTKKFKSPFTIPVVLFAGGILFYVTTSAFGMPLTLLRTHGLLPAPLSTGLVSLTNFSMNDIHWHLIFSQLGKIAVIAFISAFSLLFLTSALELSLDKDVDVNHELIIAGVSNFVLGLIGSTVNYLSFSYSTLNRNMQTNTRWVGILCGFICLVAIFCGSSILPFVPEFLLNGLIFFLGLGLFISSTFEIRKKLSVADKCIMVCIFVAVNILGLLEGVVFGIILSVIFFVINYSRIPPIRYALTGLELTSKKLHAPKAQQLINAQGTSMVYFKLQNYLFFGSANNILMALYDSVEHAPQRIKYVFYDFEQVSGIDSSLNTVFEKIKKYAKKKSITLIFTGLTKKMHTALHDIDLINEVEPTNMIIPDRDKALEIYEERILSQANYHAHDMLLPEDVFINASINRAMIRSIFSYFDQISLKKAAYLFHQGDKSKNLYYLESGHLTVFLELSANTSKRLATIGAGNIVGEMALYEQSERTASVIAESDCLLRSITPENFEKMQLEQPLIAANFNKIIASILAKKLSMMDAELMVLQN